MAAACDGSCRSWSPSREKENGQRDASANVGSTERLWWTRRAEIGRRDRRQIESPRDEIGGGELVVGVPGDEFDFRDAVRVKLDSSVRLAAGSKRPQLAFVVDPLALVRRPGPVGLASEPSPMKRERESS